MLPKVSEICFALFYFFSTIDKRCHWSLLFPLTVSVYCCCSLFDFTPLSHPLCGMELMIWTSTIRKYIQITCTWAVTKCRDRFYWCLWQESWIVLTRCWDSSQLKFQPFTMKKILLEGFLWWDLMRREAQHWHRICVGTNMNKCNVCDRSTCPFEDRFIVSIYSGDWTSFGSSRGEDHCYYVERR